MAFDKGSLIADRLNLIVEDLAGEENSLLDRVFPREETDRHKYTVDVMPSTGLPKAQGKLADGAPSQPRKAKLASVTGFIDGRYEGSYSFSESERRELENTNIRLERYARAAQADAAFNVDKDLASLLVNGTYFQSITRTGAAYTDVTAPFLKDLLAASKKLGRREDLIVIMGNDVADEVRFNDDVKAETSNYAAGFVDNTSLAQAVRSMGFRDLIMPGRGSDLGKNEQDGITPVTLQYNFDGLVWIGRPDAVVNVELGTAGSGMHYMAQTKEWLLDYYRFIDIKAVLESKQGGAFIASPIG